MPCTESDTASTTPPQAASRVEALSVEARSAASVSVVGGGPLAFEALDPGACLAAPPSQGSRPRNTTWLARNPAPSGEVLLPALPDAFEGMTDNLGAPVTYLMGCAKGAEMLMDNVKFENCVVADLDDDVVSQYESVGLGVHKVAIVVGSGGGPRKPLAFCGVLLPRAPARCLVGARDLEHVILPTPFAARFWTRWTT